MSFSLSLVIFMVSLLLQEVVLEDQDKKFSVNLLSCFFHHINLSVQWEGDFDVWSFSGFYGWSKPQ